MQRAVRLDDLQPLLYLIVSSSEGRLLFSFTPFFFTTNAPFLPPHPFCHYVGIFHLFLWAILCVYNRVDNARSAPSQIRYICIHT